MGIYKDHTISGVLTLLESELSRIAAEIEGIPFSGDRTLTKKEIVAYQKLDFCSQKLNDFSNVLMYLAKDTFNHGTPVSPDILKNVSLEYTKNLLTNGIFIPK